MGEEAAHLLGSRARGRDGMAIGSVIAADATEMRLEIPGAGVARVPHGDLLRIERGEIVLRHGQSWYAQIAREPEGASAGLEDGRLHDVSVNGGPPLAELQPGIEAGDAPLRPTTATERGLRSSSIGDARAAPAPELPELDVAARGLSIESSDRIDPGAPGSHRGGVERTAQTNQGAAMNESEKHYLVGLAARGSDGRVVGRVLSCDPESFTLERGHLVPRDQFVPYDQIVRVEEGVVILREPAAYYLEGGDLEDGEWNAEIAHRSREVAGEAPTHQLSPEQEDERAPARGEPEPGVHVPVGGPPRRR